MMPSRAELYALDPGKEMLRYKRALREIINVLGPELADCDDCQNGCQGLAVEAGEALKIAKDVLDGNS